MTLTIKWAFILYVGLVSQSLSGQRNGEKLFISYGYKSIPLYIVRTDVTRWMIYPSIEAGYRIKDKIFVTASYLYHDIRQGNYSFEKFELYSETPQLESYEQAKKFIGKKFGTSGFYDYVFAGISYDLIQHHSLCLITNFQVGYRGGSTLVISNVLENPTGPNGFEAYLENLNSTGPGLELYISPKIILWNFLSIDISLGSYLFFKWPTFQPFGSAHGVSF